MRPLVLSLVFATALAVGITLGSTASRQPAVEVRDLDDGGRVVGRVVLDPPGSFVLTFTHSMYGGSVAEAYRVVDGMPPRLERGAVRTETGGAAEYYALYGNTYRDGDTWVVEVPPLALPRLAVRVDQIGRPAIETDRRTVSLLGLVPEGHRAELRPSILVSLFLPAGV